MALEDLSVLDQYKATPFAPGAPPDAKTFFSPVDQVHETLKALLSSANKSLIVAMYGFDDADLNDILFDKMTNEDCFVQLTLDSSQAGGAKEKNILSIHDWPATSIAVGRSEKGAIMHMKMVIIDGVDVVTGSTNWSSGGEMKQDNQLTVVRNATFAAESRSRIDSIHANMLQKALKTAASPVS